MASVLERISGAALRALGARTVTVPTSAGTVHAYDFRGAGAGTFLLVHGIGTASTAYTAVVRGLRRKAARIVAIDLPGHGRSAAAADVAPATLRAGLREAADALADPAEPAVVLGTSLGGALAAGYAIERPAQVRALVLVSPAGAPLTAAEIDELRVRFALRTRADGVRFLGELLHAPPWYIRAFAGSLARQIGRPAIQDFFGGLSEEMEFLAREDLGRIAAPVTLLWGKSDRILPRSGLAFYRDALPAGTRVVELDGVGHSPHFEAPGLLVRHLAEAYDTSVNMTEEVRAAGRTASGMGDR